jgi:hypothetical protein
MIQIVHIAVSSLLAGITLSRAMAIQHPGFFMERGGIQ